MYFLALFGKRAGSNDTLIERPNLASRFWFLTTLLKGTRVHWISCQFQGCANESTRWVWNIFLLQKIRKLPKNVRNILKNKGFNMKGLPLAKYGTI